MRGILSGYGNVWENMFWVGQKPFENFVVGYMIFFSGTFSNNFSFFTCNGSIMQNTFWRGVKICYENF